MNDRVLYAFRALGMSGMSISQRDPSAAPPLPLVNQQRPLLNRCPGQNGSCGRVISANKEACKACIDAEAAAEAAAILAEIERYKLAWAARLDSGRGGPVTADEEGNEYAEGRIVNGKMTLPYKVTPSTEPLPGS